MAALAVMRCGSSSFLVSQQRECGFSGWEWKRKRKLATPNWQCRRQTFRPLRSTVRSELATYTSRISTDISLYESPQASFDQYLEDKPRVFKAMFPDTRRSQQLNEDEWRIKMLPIQFLFFTSTPVVDMRLRCKSGGVGYPPGVPLHVNRVIDLGIIRWELPGLEDVLKPSNFSLDVEGSMYADRSGNRTRLKGQLVMSITVNVPPVMALIPEGVRKDVTNMLLKRLVENMKQKVNSSVLADYSRFKNEKEALELV